MVVSLQYLVGQELTWIPIATFKSQYNLITREGAILSTLDMSNWTSKASATVPEGILFFQKESWSGMKTTISLGEQGLPLATYQSKWTGTRGQLLFPDSREFKWGKLNFWGTQKSWTNPLDNTIYIQFSTGSFSRKVTAMITPSAAAIPELSLLLALGLYNILVERRAAAAAS